MSLRDLKDGFTEQLTWLGAGLAVNGWKDGQMGGQRFLCRRSSPELGA